MLVQMRLLIWLRLTERCRYLCWWWYFWSMILLMLYLCVINWFDAGILADQLRWLFDKAWFLGLDDSVYYCCSNMMLLLHFDCSGFRWCRERWFACLLKWICLADVYVLFRAMSDDAQRNCESNLPVTHDTSSVVWRVDVIVSGAMLTNDEKTWSAVTEAPRSSHGAHNRTNDTYKWYERSTKHLNVFPMGIRDVYWTSRRKEAQVANNK
jgi:hypothetical protein